MAENSSSLLSLPHLESSEWGLGSRLSVGWGLGLALLGRILTYGGSSHLPARAWFCHNKVHLAKMFLAFLLFDYFGFSMIGWDTHVCWATQISTELWIRRPDPHGICLHGLQGPESAMRFHYLIPNYKWVEVGQKSLWVSESPHQHFQKYR